MRQMAGTAGWTARSGGELLAALPAAGLDDGSPSTGRHAVTEPVVLGPLALVGLESALHAVPPRRWTSTPGRQGWRRVRSDSSGAPGATMGTGPVLHLPRGYGLSGPTTNTGRRRAAQVSGTFREEPLALPPWTGASFPKHLVAGGARSSTERHPVPCRWRPGDAGLPWSVVFHRCG